jgi:hypothetical protein
MRQIFIAATIFVVFSLPSIASTSQTGFGPTWQQQRNCQGTGCGANTPHDCGPSEVRISPNPISASAGKKITLRFDASAGCNGQGIEKFKGTVQWETGASESLNDSYGFATYVFETGGEQDVVFDMAYACVDVSGRSDCHSAGRVHVHVNP